jgi:hypothetical protein
MSEISTTPIPNESPEGSKAPTRKRSLRWRIFRFCVLSFVGLITLFALFHAEENWRGKRAWEQYRKEQEAKGVSFDFNSVVPPPIPEEKNFAMTPLLKRGLELHPRDVRVDFNGGPSRFKNPAANFHLGAVAHELPTSNPWDENKSQLESEPVWRRGDRIDLEQWQKAFMTSTNFPHRSEPSQPAQDVLFALSRFQKEFAELDQASRERPLCRFEVKYEEEEKFGIWLPHLSMVRGLCRRLSLSSAAKLQLGQVEEALADVKLIFYLAESVKEDPFIVSQLVRQSCLQLGLQIIWEGLMGHRWKAEHLEHWQRKFADYDCVRDTYKALEAERLLGNSEFEVIRRYPYIINNVAQVFTKQPKPRMDLSMSYFPDLLWKLVPQGWFYLEQVNYNRAFEEYLLSPAAKEKTKIDLQKNLDATRGFMRLLQSGDQLSEITSHTIIVRNLLPNKELFFQKGVYTQSTVDLAIVAMALERYYLKHQDYPETLAALVTDYASSLPLDILSKAPFKYERQSKDAFRLWSVGWNLKDDGGVIERNGKKPDATIILEEGDWTWPQLMKSDN